MKHLYREPNTLTPREQELYDFLVEHKGTVLGRERINGFMGWAPESRSCDVYVGYLKDKGVKIYTIRGFGYAVKS